MKPLPASTSMPMKWGGPPEPSGFWSMQTPSAHLPLMRRAIALAERAAAMGEVPVGAVLMLEGEIIGEGFNQPITTHDPTAHAEIAALRAAGARLEAYRLPGSTMVVTLEPCPMCIGAMIHARVARVVYGASDPKTGACGGAMRLHEDPTHNHRLLVEGGLEAETCSAMLREFFRARRRT